MPLRKNVIVALFALASSRKRENRWSSFSSAPSQENTTNCGGCSPGFSLSAFNWWGCGPASDIEPSPSTFTLPSQAGAVAPPPAPAAASEDVPPAGSGASSSTSVRASAVTAQPASTASATLTFLLRFPALSLRLWFFKAPPFPAPPCCRAAATARPNIAPSVYLHDCKGTAAVAAARPPG